MPTTPFNTINQEEIRSHEVQDIVGQVPSWIIRWGITLVFLVLVMILFISWFIKYPDMVKGKVLITTHPAPAYLVSNENGLMVLLVGDKETVTTGQDIGYIQNNAKYEDILTVEKMLSHDIPVQGLQEKQPALGEMQPLYSRWKIALQKQRNLVQYHPEKNEIVFLDQQIKNLTNLNANLQQQTALLAQEVQLAGERFRIDSMLHAEGVISPVDFKERTTGFLQAKRTLTNQTANLLNNEYQVVELRKQSNRLMAGASTEMAATQQEINGLQQELLTAIANWKRRYVFTAPFDGEVSFMDFLQDGQFVQAGTSLFAVVPGEENFYARVTLPVMASGKVDVGQEVNIRLDHYPSHEFGMLTGKISDISIVPTQEASDPSYYILKVGLKNGLTTTYNKQLPLRQHLSGEIEVITNDLRLIQRLFNWLREITRYQ